MTSAPLHPYLIALLHHHGDDPRSPANPPVEKSEWPDVIEEATAHGLLPLLWHRIEALPSKNITLSLEDIDNIKTSISGTIARNLVLSEELASILRTFATHGVPCIPIRGPALAEQLYGDLVTRSIGDLDLLVKRDRLSEVTDLLRGMGYREIDRRPGFARAYSYTLEFLKDRHGSIMVEPHWTIAYPPFTDRMDMEEVWQRTLPASVVGVDTRQLGRTDLFLHLCFHLIHKGDEAPLLWWYELGLVMRDHSSIDWSLVIQTAQQTGQASLLHETLTHLHALLRTPLPEALLQQLAVATDRPGESTAMRRLNRRLTPLLIGATGVDGRESLALFLTIKGLRAKWRYALGILFPSPAFMRLHYGLSKRSFLGLRYLSRLLYFLVEGGKGVWGMLIPRPSHR